MDGLTWTDCDEAGDHVVPNVFSLRNLVSSLTTWTKLYYTQPRPRYQVSVNSTIVPLVSFVNRFVYNVALFRTFGMQRDDKITAGGF